MTNTTEERAFPFLSTLKEELEPTAEPTNLLTCKIKKAFKLKDGTDVPVGISVGCEFKDARLHTFVVHFSGKKIRFPYRLASKYLTRFKPEPSMRALEKMSNDGVVTTPLGARTEPDGHGPNGEPSWLLVMGLI